MFLCVFQHGVDVNKADFYGKTPLQYATESDQRAIVKMLIEAGLRFLSNDIHIHRNGLVI